MRTTVAEQENGSVRLDVEVSAEEIEESLQTTIRTLAREVRLPGFRKGKVPAGFIEQRFGEHALIHQMLEDHLSDWYTEAVGQANIEPVDVPQVDYDDEPERGKPFAFRAVVAVMPTPSLGEYLGVEVPREHPEVADDEVTARVDRLRDEFAELRVVTDRSVQEGDFVTIDARGSLNGEPVESAVVSDYALEVGRGQLVRDLEQALVGMAPGTEATVPVTLPEDYGVEGLDGQTLDFSVAVKEVKEKVLPSANDEFAKDVSEFETLLELRLDIRKKLQASKDTAAERAYRNAAVRAAVDNATVDLPDVVVERQAREMVEDFARSISVQGGDFAQYLEATGSSADDLVAGVRGDAELQVKTSLVLDAVAAAEELSLSEEELQSRVGALAAASQVEPDELHARLVESGRIEAIRQQLLREKAADLIVDQAVPVEAVAPTEEGGPAQEAATEEEAAAGPVEGAESTRESASEGEGVESEA